jgi:hypothetical protein
LTFDAVLDASQTWGEAYGHDDLNHIASFHHFKSFITAEQELAVDGIMLSNSLTTNFFRIQAPPGLKSDWPSAQEHPFFYIGFYSLIGLATVLTSVAAYVLQFTGALKASRTLFKQLLIGVVRATMRWHDVTPQG